MPRTTQGEGWLTSPVPSGEPQGGREMGIPCPANPFGTLPLGGSELPPVTGGPPDLERRVRRRRTLKMNRGAGHIFLLGCTQCRHRVHPHRADLKRFSVVMVMCRRSVDCFYPRRIL